MIRVARFALALVALFAFGLAAAAAAPKLRLGDTVRPVRYAARLTVDPAEPTFRATVDIELNVRAATEVVWLNATGLNISSARFEAGGATVTAQPVTGGPDFVGFRPAKALPVGNAKLHIEYTGPLSRKDDRGLFAQKEGDRWYAITQFESIFARRVFPCFDEPSFKVPWQLTIEAPKDLVIRSNTAELSQTEEHPGMKTVRFAATKPLPSYLVAFAVGPYDVVDAGHAGTNKIPVRIVAPAGRGKDARYAVKVTGEIVDRLEKYFGSPFPYDKLDILSIPLTTQFSAMENPGMITFAQRVMVARPEDESIRFQRGYTGTGTHELAHQWFGDLVTTAWWDDIWLNESFASWMANKIVDEWHPEWTHHTGLVQARERAMGADSLVSARQIRQPIVGNDDIYNAFDGITYLKGEAVLGMFEQFVGAEVFQRGIRKYLADHAYANATAEQFVAAISAAAGRDLWPAFSSFLNQPGVPLLSATLSCGAGKPASLAVTQQRYLPLGSSGSAQQKWQVPVCVSWSAAGGKTGHTCTLMTDAQATIPLPELHECPTWVDANADALGYYRVAYQGDLLQRLLKAREQLSLPALVGTLDDMRALVANGTLPLGDALALLPSLSQDPRREMQMSVLEIAGGIRDHIVPATSRAHYARFISKLFGARARKLGWQPRPGDDDDTRLLRAPLLALVADAGEDKPLRAEAVTLARKWMADRKAVSADVIGTVLNAAALGGDRALFTQMHDEAKRAKERRDRTLLLEALGHFRDPALAKEALALVLGDEFDGREAWGIVRAEASWPTTRPLAWDFVRQSFDALTKRLPAETMASSPMVAVPFCDEAHQQEMKTFFSDRSPKLPGGPRRLAQATEQIGLCVAYVKAQQASAAHFLSKF